VLTFEIKINGAMIYFCSIINEAPLDIGALQDDVVYAYRYGVYDANGCTLIDGKLTHLRSEGALALVRMVMDQIDGGGKVVTKKKKRKTKNKLDSESWNALRNILEYTADEEEDYEGRSSEEKTGHIYEHIKVLKKLLEETR
jgi:hypothetical protein